MKMSLIDCLATIHPLWNPEQYIVPAYDGHISGSPFLAAALPKS